MHLTLVNCGFLAHRPFWAFFDVKSDLHFKMQVIHIVDVHGGRHRVARTRTNDRGVVLMAAKKKAKKATKKKATKKKAAKKKK